MIKFKLIEQHGDYKRFEVRSRRTLRGYVVCRMEPYTIETRFGDGRFEAGVSFSGGIALRWYYQHLDNKQEHGPWDTKKEAAALLCLMASQRSLASNTIARLPAPTN